MPGNGAQVQPGTRDLTTPTAACASDSHDFRNEIEDVVGFPIVAISAAPPIDPRR